MPISCQIIAAHRWLARTTSAACVTLMLAACVAPSQQAPESAVLSPVRVAEIVASPDRSDADRVNDARRKPQEMLMFIGVRPGMTALDLSAAGGYTTELIARAVGPNGRVYGQSAPRPPESRPTQPEGAASPIPMPAATPSRAGGGPRPSPVVLAERAKNPNARNIVAVVRPFADPAPPECASNCLDLVTLMFNYHDFGHLGVDRTAVNRAVFAALKPGGMYVIADHSGRPGTGISESGTLHRIEEAFLRAEVEQAGFKLASEGNFLRNPSDPRDRNTPEPPQPKDEFVLKFVKP
ncbi:hypothetical protein WKW77_32690 [Variovorax ureilyticus]|uniref:Methyltransferase n=1 Tax=Variovorax ureilyticus TaxID=1836198 RepID=A0ABU8VQI9_9BURK